MRTLRALLRRLGSDARGAVLVETAIVAPTLIIMCIGSFEVATMIEKQSRLQTTAELATEIAVISSPDTEAERAAIEGELSAALPPSAAIQVVYKYRCGVETTLSTTPPSGCEEEYLSTYLHIALEDRYEPVWADFGIGSAFDYDVQRTVQVS